MIKKLVIIFSIVSIAVLSSCKTKSTDKQEGDSLVSVSTDDAVQILVRADGAPGMYLGEDGDVHGFYVDLERMIMEEMGQNYNFVPYDDILFVVNAIITGTHHIALAVPDVPDYRAVSNLSIPYEDLHFTAFVQKGNTSIGGSTKEEIIESFNGKKIGVQATGHIYQELRDLEGLEIVEFPTTTKALEALNNGEVDAVPDVKRIGDYYTKLNNWEIESVGDPIITLKVTTGISKIYDQAFVDRYNKALSTLISNGSVEELYNNFLNQI